MVPMRSLAVLFGILVCSLGQVNASQIAYTVDNTTGQSLGNPPFTLGFEFTVNSAINVTSLGMFDDSQDGLVESHDVGLYDAGGTLLASTTIASGTGSSLTDQFRYESIGSVLLVAGNYFIGALYESGNDQLLFPNDAVNFQTDPSITFVQSAFAPGNVLTFPSTGGSDLAYFGPNFQFDAPTAVPEPASLTLAGMGAAGLVIGAIRRRRQQKAV